MNRVRSIVVSALAALAAGAEAQSLIPVPPRYGYLLFLPKKTWASNKKWPLILYLHGRSLSGNDLSRLTAYGLPKRLQTDKGFPFIVVAPQVPAGQRWTDTKGLANLVDLIARNYPVDRSRVYVMGFSMGASGAWRVAHDYPDRFAAVVSIGGLYEPPLATSGRLKRTPIWMFHGTEDTEASPAAARKIFNLHRNHGGTGVFTDLPGEGHNIPHVFNRSDVYHWLLRHRKSAPR